MDKAMRMVLILGYLVSIFAVVDQRPHFEDEGGTSKVNADFDFGFRPSSNTVQPVTTHLENPSDDLGMTELWTSTIKPVSFGNSAGTSSAMVRGKQNAILQSKAEDSLRIGPLTKFPSALPVLDSLAIAFPYALPGLIYFEHHHPGLTISTKLMKLEDELVAPIKSTTLEGQGLIWIHEADEIIETYKGRETVPDIVTNLTSMFVTKPVNGIPRRLQVMTYVIGGRIFVYEPDNIYISECSQKGVSTALMELDIQHPRGLRHRLFELTNITSTLFEEKMQVFLKIHLVADYTFYKQFANQFEQPGTSLRLMEKTKVYLRYLLSLLNETLGAVDLQRYKVALDITKIEVAERPEKTPFLEKAKIDDKTVEGETAMTLHKNEPGHDQINEAAQMPHYVTIVLTGYKIVSQGQKVSGLTSSNNGCGSVVLLTHQGSHTNSMDLLNHFGMLIGVDRSTTSNCSGDGLMSETLDGEEFLKPQMTASCIADSLENAIDKLMEEKAQCLSSISQREENHLNDLQNPGQIFNLQEQCEIVFGPGYKPCRENTSQDVCFELFCSNISNLLGNGCRSLPSLKAMEGSLCANQSWCKESACVYDVSAPEIDEVDKPEKDRLQMTTEDKTAPVPPTQVEWLLWISSATLVLVAAFMTVRLYSWAVEKCRKKQTAR